MSQALNPHDRTPERFALAIDLGSGGPRAAVVSETGRVVARAAGEVQTLFSPGGGAEQDAGQWWEGSLEAARRAIADSGVAPDAIAVVGCDSQYSLIVPVDRELRPLMNAVHWMDTRGGKYNRELMAGFPSFQGYGVYKLSRWLRLCGVAPTRSGVDSLGHILFIKNELPEIYRETHCFLEPMDYLTSRLIGRPVATQHTALLTMAVDNRSWGEQRYCDELLRLGRLEAGKLPPLIAGDAIAGGLSGEAAAALGLAPGTPVAAGINDTEAAAVGSGAVEDFEAAITLGTSMALTCHVPFKKLDILHMMMSTPSAIRSRYLFAAEQGTGGKCLEFLVKQILFPERSAEASEPPFDRADRLAAAVAPGSDRVLFLPWLTGSIAPEEDSRLRAGLLNLGPDSTRGHLVRAAMEGVAYNNRWTLGPAERFLGRPFRRLRFCGGGARSDLWAQIHADVLALPIHRLSQPADAPLRGTALLALHRLGGIPLEQMAARIEIDRVFEPDPANRPIYGEMYRRFQQARRGNRPLFAALNG